MKIGQLVHDKLNEQNKSVVWLAQQLSCSRTNVYKIFVKDSLDTSLLLRLSVIFRYDFFKSFSEEYRFLTKKG